MHAYSPNLTLFGNVDLTYFKVRLIFLRFHILIWSSKNLCEGSNYSLKYLVFWMLLEQLSDFGRKCLGHLKVLAINAFSQQQRLRHPHCISHYRPIWLFAVKGAQVADDDAIGRQLCALKAKFDQRKQLLRVCLDQFRVPAAFLIPLANLQVQSASTLPIRRGDALLKCVPQVPHLDYALDATRWQRISLLKELRLRSSGGLQHWGCSSFQ